MRKKNRPLWRFVAFTYLTLGFGTFTAHGQVQSKSYTPLAFSAEIQYVENSLKLATQHYKGEGKIVISPNENQHCTLEIAEGSFVENVCFEVRRNGHLRIRDSLLRHCQIWLEPGAEVTLDSCGLDRCEFTGEPSATPTPPTFRIINCILNQGAWMIPMNYLGLEMMDSVVMEQNFSLRLMRLQSPTDGNSWADYARRPMIRYTRFENSLVHATLLLTVSQVTMEKCQGLFLPGKPAIGTEDKLTKTMLPMRWENCMPPEPPTTVVDGVGIQRITTPISGGCTLTGKIEDEVLSLEKIAVTDPVTIQSAIPSTADNSNDLKLKQSIVNGLLVMPLASGSEAGQVTRMNMTVVPGSANLRFSQQIGDDMATALKEVQKFIQLRHSSLPRSLDFEIAFEEKYSGKDGPSAAVACALLSESLLTGQTWDPAFAVTGDMNADGMVQPIGGVAAKVRGATRGDCRIVAVPLRNETAVSDLLIQDGPALVAGIHIFSLTHFDQAVTLASIADRPPVLQQAIDEFEIIRTTLQRNPQQMVSILRTPQAAARLQAILEKAPNSLSAKYLLLFSQGRMPTSLSLSGSIEAADNNALGLVSSIKNDFKGTVSSLQRDELGSSLNRLRNLRPRLDQRTWPYIDGLVRYGEIVREEVLHPSLNYNHFKEMASRANQAANAAIAAKDKLLADPKVLEELGL
ncbi:MAG: hypothetical protein OJI67_02455 [Prosthecobacter sp.]|nr:hypothetical protein [Prosthecobacter sp.]